MQHPLQFFQDLLVPSQVDQIKQKFYSTYYEEMILEVDKEREFMRIMNPFDSESESIVRYFHNHFKEICLSEQHNTLQIIQSDILRLGDRQKEKLYLLKILSNIEDLRNKYKINEALQRYVFTLDCLQSIEEYIISQYQLKGLLSITEENEKPRQKFHWLGNTNVLVTLFFDLWKGQDKKQAFISSSEESIQKFIYDSFLDKEGYNLEMKTITKYWNEAHKRAKKGKRIEIPEVEE